MNCIFCRIAKKEISDKIFYEDEYAVGFLDINPIAKGHALVVPKEHARTFLDMKEKDLCGLILAVQKVVGALKTTIGGEDFSYNILQNNGEKAGQTVDHVHFHIIPQSVDAGFHLEDMWNPIQVTQNELKELLTELKNNF